MVNIYFIIILSIGFGLLDQALSLHITKFSVPPEEAHEAHLVCQYNLAGGKLYDAKWYKDDKNFFKCSDDGTQKYPVEGISVYSWEPMSSSCSLTLTSLTSKSAGLYKCEVTLDAPSFPTLSSKGELRVNSASKLVQPTDSPTTIAPALSGCTKTNISLVLLTLLYFFRCIPSHF